MNGTGTSLTFIVTLFILTFVTNIYGHIDNGASEKRQIQRYEKFLNAANGKHLPGELKTIIGSRAMELFRVRRDVLVTVLGKGMIKAGVHVSKWVMRWKRKRRALGIMKAGATLWKKDEDLRIEYYTKPGGDIRARRDFWEVDAFGIKPRKRINQGSVGDSVVELHDKYSEKLPYPALMLYRKTSPEMTRGTVTVVLYK